MIDRCDSVEKWLKNLNHWRMFSYFCLHYGMHCATWIDQESLSNLNTLLNATDSATLWFSCQCRWQNCHEQNLSSTPASARNEIWWDFKLSRSKVLGNVKSLIQSQTHAFLLRFTSDLWSTQRRLGSQANCTKSADETTWFPKHVFEIYSYCEEVTGLVLQWPQWLRSQDLCANTLSLKVVSKGGWMRIQVSLFQLIAFNSCCKVKVKSTQSWILNQEQHVQCSWLRIQIQPRFCAETVSFHWCADFDSDDKFDWNATNKVNSTTDFGLRSDLTITTVKISRLVLRFSAWVRVICSGLKCRDFY